MNEKARVSSVINRVFIAPSQKHHVLIACLVLLLTACRADMSEVIQAPPGDTQVSPTTSVAHTPRPLGTATLIPTPLISPTPQPVVLAVPTRWAEAALKSLEEVDTHGSPWFWQLNIHDDPNVELMLQSAQIALVPGDEGIFSGQRPLALVVPFTSQLDSITLAEAQQVLTDGSPFIAVMDWADTPATHRALKIDGLRPGDSGYPLIQSWSLRAPPGYEAAAAELAPILGDRLSEDVVISLTAVGDVMLDRALGDAIRAGKVNYPFAEVTDLLASADLTIGNLESALGDRGSPANKGYTFRAPPQAAETLAQAGFDLLSLANNHALDYGPLALQQAMDLLNQQEIATVGAGTNDTSAHEPYIHEIHGLTLAFLSYVHVPVEVRGFNTQTWTATADSPGMAWADPDRIQADVSTALDWADLVIVLLHSGYENVPEPSPPQVEAARAAIDGGASLVIGHHTHVLQGIEYYNGGVIIYGLGNFAFEDGGPPESALLNIWLDGDGVRGMEFMPVIIEVDGQPRLAVENEANTILQWIYSLTEALNQP